MTRRYQFTLAALLLALPLAVCAGACAGAYPIAAWRVPAIVWGHLEDEGYRVLMFIRFPRVALAALVGGAMAVSGASLQSMFRNPLADPGLIGVSSGAALSAALWIVLAGGASALGVWGLPIAAFSGGLAVVALVWRFAHSNGHATTATLLLTGIALNAIAGAGIGLLMYCSNEEQLRGITFWQMGGLGGATWPLVFTAGPVMLAGLATLLPLGQTLNTLTLGEAEAYHLGVSIRSVQRRIVYGSALAVGGAVAAAGGIGFIGLVAPQLLRLACGADNRWLLPCAFLVGAIMLVIADTAARTVAQPAEMPVGVLTALAGGPFFLWLLIRYKREASHA